jgi:hypothetical protein
MDGKMADCGNKTDFDILLPQMSQIVIISPDFTIGGKIAHLNPLGAANGKK